MADQTFTFRISNIDLISKEVKPQPSTFAVGKSLGFDVTSESRVNPERKFLVQFIRLFIIGEENTPALASFIIACEYEILDFDAHIKLAAENKYNIDTDLELFLKSTSISTARGIVWSELRGTYLHTAIFPIINVATMVPREDFIINEIDKK